MPIIHSVKRPFRIRNLIAFSLISLVWSYMVIRSWSHEAWNDKDTEDIIVLFFQTLLLLMYYGSLILTLYRGFKKPTELYMNPDEITVNGRTIQANEVKVVMKMGYFRPVIGIKPIGKKVVPLKLCFKFSENEDQGISDIQSWAETNRIKIVNQDFMTWL
ncbi:hypothetical protein M3194_13705 [Paenibacillus glycanilyticus]|uniref:hypothetical protein n=1 Tax=Paenibacillus glycanilyticus TaxID=126569 RepID=UPI00203C1D84|nr:hypothetical protein [Paenibacillus glycanilyticus]MCM3628419.1 hypothetical protein [Paenibacillus glycanilyticus]